MPAGFCNDDTPHCSAELDEKDYCNDAVVAR